MEAIAVAKKSDQIIRSYLQENLIYIIDTSGVSRARLARILVDIGANTQKIKIFGSYEQAEYHFNVDRPKIVFSEFRLGCRSGLDLFESFRKISPSKESLFVLITSNSSQAVVARAAEEDVDAFILKPYTINTVKKIFVKTAMDKLYPSEYIRTIEEGKEQLFAGNYPEALEIFEKAKRMSDTPTLAFFYYGQAEYMLKEIRQAEKSYEEGLQYNKIHYKCLVGLFDLMMEKQQYKEAYDIVRMIAEYFPANPKRLATIIHLAVKTENYSDIEDYYNFFVNFNYRSEELTRYVCSALLICGKYYLMRGFAEKAFNLFEKVGITAQQGHTKYLRILIEYMTEFNQHDYYDAYIRRFTNDTYNTVDYKLASFLTKHLHMQPTKIVGQCQEFLRNGVDSSSLFYLMIQNNLKLGRTDDMEEAYREALKRWPEKSYTFHRAKQLP